MVYLNHFVFSTAVVGIFFMVLLVRSVNLVKCGHTVLWLTTSWSSYGSPHSASKVDWMDKVSIIYFYLSMFIQICLDTPSFLLCCSHRSDS